MATPGARGACRPRARPPPPALPRPRHVKEEKKTLAVAMRRPMRPPPAKFATAQAPDAVRARAPAASAHEGRSLRLGRVCAARVRARAPAGGRRLAGRAARRRCLRRIWRSAARWRRIRRIVARRRRSHRTQQTASSAWTCRRCRAGRCAAPTSAGWRAATRPAWPSGGADPKHFWRVERRAHCSWCWVCGCALHRRAGTVAFISQAIFRVVV